MTINNIKTTYKASELTKFKNGEPCDHPSCMQYKNNVCECCGRINGNGVAYRIPIKEKKSGMANAIDEFTKTSLGQPYEK